MIYCINYVKYTIINKEYRKLYSFFFAFIHPKKTDRKTHEKPTKKRNLQLNSNHLPEKTD